MKLIILITICLVSTVLTHNSGEFFGFGGNQNARFVNQLNRSIAKIQNATVDPSTPLSTTIVNVWDLLPSVNRYLLLNQTKVQNLGFSINQNFSAARLSWTNLPSSVQDLLSSQLTNLDVLNLSFLDWAWVNSNTDQFFNSTLYSLLSTNQVALLPNVTNLLNQIKFSQVVNRTLLRRSNGFNEICDSLRLSYLPAEFGRSKRARPGRPGPGPSFFRPPPPPPVTAWTVFNQAVSRAARFLQTNFIRF
jgi:hypothetical protein